MEQLDLRYSSYVLVSSGTAHLRYMYPLFPHLVGEERHVPCMPASQRAI